MHDTLAATDLDTAALGQVIVTTHPSGTTTLHIRKPGAWVKLTAEPGETSRTSTADELRRDARRTTLAAVNGRPSTASDLDESNDGSVLVTAAGWFFQKDHGTWWRVAETWTGACSAWTSQELDTARPRLIWEPAAD